MASHSGLVLHVQVGNGSLYGFFNNPASKASSHFWAGKNGALEQYVDTENIAWAQAAGNPNYLSVETEGYPTEPLTDAQLATVANLLSWASGYYGFPLVGPVAHGTAGFTQHCNLDGTPDPAWGNHPCPESIRMGQMPEILQLTKPPTGGYNVTSLLMGGQVHVYGTLNNKAYHWWQAEPGSAPPNPPANFYDWHVEALPLS